jgi:hypothetical protein
MLARLIPIQARIDLNLPVNPAGNLWCNGQARRRQSHRFSSLTHQAAPIRQNAAIPRSPPPSRSAPAYAHTPVLRLLSLLARDPGASSHAPATTFPARGRTPGEVPPKQFSAPSISLSQRRRSDRRALRRLSRVGRRWMIPTQCLGPDDRKPASGLPGMSDSSST